MDNIIKIIKSFKPIEAKTEIKKPVINYKSPTNNFFLTSLDSSRIDEMVNKIVEEVRKKLLSSE